MGVVICTDQEPALDQKTGVLERREPGALFMVRLAFPNGDGPNRRKDTDNAQQS
jgi:hypothetical protein